jgi:hypothetical protein
MSFSFYGYLDQNWIDSKIQEYGIYTGDVIEITTDLGFDAKSILESPNPVIYAVLDCIARQLFDSDEVQQLSDGVKEQFFSKVYDTFFVNCIDSHMAPDEVVEKMKDEIVEDLKESFPDLPAQEINNKYKRLLELCEEHSF